MLVHILGEVGTLYTILLIAYFRRRLLIFIEIGLYLTGTEQKNSRHVF